jgi:glutaredoxin
MATHTIEVFSAGCPTCTEAVELVRRAAGSQHVEVLNMNQPTVEAKAKQYGVHRVPAVAIDGKLAECCLQGGVQEDVIRAALR